ncbi:MAG: DHHW family protein, partial [Oscillospiraceae bacterium]|nr:DHHW family protein [Oscillospiraceae bacterium]
MNKRRAAAVALFFFLPLLGLGLVSVWNPDRLYSPGENRALAQKPPFSRNELFSGRWTGDFDEYYTDQFPARERLMTLSARAGRWLYIALRDGSAVIGGDFDLDAGLGGGGTVAESGDNFFLILGDRIMHMPESDPANAKMYAAFLGRVQDALPDSRVISMVVPNSFPLCAPQAYMTDARDQRRAITALYDSLDSRIVTVDAYAALAAHADEYLYFRTDHHWTARGAYRAYTAFCNAAGFEPDGLETWEGGQYNGFVGFFYRQVQQHPQAAAAAAKPATVGFFLPPAAHTPTASGDGSKNPGR